MFYVDSTNVHLSQKGICFLLTCDPGDVSLPDETEIPQDSEEFLPDETEIKTEPQDSSNRTKDIRFTKTKFEPVILFINNECSKSIRYRELGEWSVSTRLETETTLNAVLPFCPDSVEDDHVSKMTARAEELRQLARMKTLKAHIKYHQRYDSKHRMMSYAPGDCTGLYPSPKSRSLREIF
ncbi:hypothetical protein NPIL_553751 [Nephila pilipes]|uniref:Uncharacterized protein n=1 Tax=Nephila pilipes TaxID=299642 RepID=A0A8X6IMR3_NEPPI|nr:hypothetical protein NPIL_553751 [Nephila pilipes]